MNENELALRLSRLKIPGREVALDRCLDAYREPAIAHEPPLQRVRFMPRRPLRLALAFAMAAGIVALAFTPPGRAVADWVADLVGVGEPPTATQEPIWSRKWTAAPPKPTVIASGLTPQGEPFEWVVRGVLHRNDRGICLSLQFPTQRSPDAGGGCSEQIPSADPAYPVFAYGSSTGSGDGAVVDGILTSEVKSVELSYPVDGEAQTLDPVMGRITPEMLRKLGGNPKNPRGVFIAFLPEGVSAEEVTAIGYDAEGNAVGTTRWPDVEELYGPGAEERRAYSEAEVYELTDVVPDEEFLGGRVGNLKHWVPVRFGACRGFSLTVTDLTANEPPRYIREHGRVMGFLNPGWTVVLQTTPEVLAKQPPECAGQAQAEMNKLPE